MGSLKHLWSRFCGWRHMDWHKTCSLNPRVYSVLDESIFQTCFHTNIASKNPALTPWAGEIQKNCILFLGKGSDLCPQQQGYYRGSKQGASAPHKVSPDPCREHRGLLQVFPFAGSHRNLKGSCSSLVSLGNDLKVMQGLEMSLWFQT